MPLIDKPPDQTGKAKFSLPEHMIVCRKKDAIDADKPKPPEPANEDLRALESKARNIESDGIELQALSDDSEARLASATRVVKQLLSEVKADCGAPFEIEAVEALAVIRQRTPAEYRRIRAELNIAT